MESLLPASTAPLPTRTSPARARNTRRRAAALFMVMAFALGLFAVGPAAPTAQAASLKVCGEVTLYVKATTLLNGALTIGSTALVIAAGTTLPSTVQVGSNLCLDLTLDTSGRITDATVSANATATVNICGQVSAYAKATATSTGSLTIAGRTFTVAIGTVLPSSVTAGADLCLHLTLNGFGQVSGGTAQANVTSTLDVCGQVTAYAAASSTTNGHLTIGSVSKTIAAGATLSSSIKLNAYLKLRLTIDAFGRIAGATVLKVGVSVADACGTTAPAPTAAPTSTPVPGGGGGATPTPGGGGDNGTPVPGPGGGTPLPGGGTPLPGGGTPVPGGGSGEGTPAPGETQVPGTAQGPGGTSAPGGATLPDFTAEACGQVSLYTAPTASSDGRLIIGNLDQAIVPGTAVSDVVKAGAFLFLRLHLGQPDRIDDLTVLRLGASLGEVCDPISTGTCCNACTTGATTGLSGLPDLGSLVQAGGPLSVLSIPALLLGGMLLGAAFWPRRLRGLADGLGGGGRRPPLPSVENEDGEP
jgi:hypothetical protein